MSLKYTYLRFFSIFLACIIAWNSFGYIGVYVGSSIIKGMIHFGDECEMMFCYCKTVDGQKKCTCHHHNKMNEHYPDSSSHCITDLKLAESNHKQIIVNWYSKIYLVDTSDWLREFNEQDIGWNGQSFSLKETYISPPLRPPAFV